MQKQFFNKKSSKEDLEIVFLETKIKVEVPKDVLEKMKFLCTIISSVEWSGILLYEVQGTILKPEEMKIVLKDIILMDKGNSTYTDYKYNEQKRDSSGYEDKHIDYCEEFEDGIFYKIGHIHSHNSMNVFFSSVDMSELNDNCGGHNYYLSFIVNNKMEFEAKIAFLGESSQEVETSFTALDQEGNRYTVHQEKTPFTSKKMFVYNCEIDADLSALEEENFFMRSVSEVLNRLPKAKPVIKSFTTETSKKPVGNPFNKPYYNFPSHSFSQEEDPMEEFERDHFNKFLIRLISANSLRIFNSLDEALRNAKPKTVKWSFEENYTNTFKDFYPNVGMEEFYEIALEVEEVLKIKKDKFPFLNTPISFISNLINKIENGY